jgi:hypothetical protein
VRDAPDPAGEGDEVQALELQGDPTPRLPGLALGEGDYQQREPAQQDVIADAALEAVEHGPQLEGALEVTEPTFGFEQVLVAQARVMPASGR